jgi:hypothetical protein
LALTVLFLPRDNSGHAARVAGVAEKTLRRWIREPEFKATYLQVQRASIILKLMTDPNVPAAVRLRTAESVFDRRIKAIKLYV